MSGYSASAETQARAADDTPQEDVWHQVTPASPFFNADLRALRMAAVVQSDGRFARIVLSPDGQGAYVTVNLPGALARSELQSDLTFGNGATTTRTVQAEALDVLIMTTSPSVTYSFAVAPEDVRAFRRARHWTVTPRGGAPVVFTLNGSARAIDAALSDPRPFAVTSAGADALDPGLAAFSASPVGIAQ